MAVRNQKKHRFPRRKLDPSNTPQGTMVVLTAAIHTTKVRVVANQSVNCNGVPQLLVQGIPPISVAQVDAVTLDLTYAVAPVVTNVYSLAGGDPAIRSSNGGYCQALAGVF